MALRPEGNEVKDLGDHPPVISNESAMRDLVLVFIAQILRCTQNDKVGEEARTYGVLTQDP